MHIIAQDIERVEKHFKAELASLQKDYEDTKTLFESAKSAKLSRQKYSFLAARLRLCY